eukprot:m.52175 g.52175  ORF g.52175 m.52175 type:complete len:151 (-) comp15304_c0_seq1:36-488(-)
MARPRRLAREFEQLKASPPPHVQLLTEDGASDTWQMRVEGAPGTVYHGESFTLQMKFPDKYPFESPEVMFIGTAPQHPHIYSNGHICLSLLGDDWSPALTASTLCTSILSMMSSCQVKEWPEDNDPYVRRWQVSKFSPKKTRWYFHDDNV